MLVSVLVCAVGQQQCLWRARDVCPLNMVHCLQISFYDCPHPKYEAYALGEPVPDFIHPLPASTCACPLPPSLLSPALFLNSSLSLTLLASPLPLLPHVFFIRCQSQRLPAVLFWFSSSTSFFLSSSTLSAFRYCRSPFVHFPQWIKTMRKPRGNAGGRRKRRRRRKGGRKMYGGN